MERLYASIFPRELSLSRKLCATAVVFSGTFVLTRSLLRFVRSKKPAGNLPPGIPSVPFLGSMPFLPQRDRMHIFLTEKARELGPVFTLNLPNRHGVVISGREMIYEAFVKQSLVFASRPFSITNPGCKGFLNHPYDSAFRRYHQLSLNILKKFGFGKGIMETRIQVEVGDLLANLQKLNGSAICADQLITSSVSNVIAGIVFGKRFDHSSQELADLIGKFHEFVCLSRDRMAVDFLPIVRFLPKYRRCMNSLVKVNGDLLKYMDSKIDAGLEGELPESFITHFLQWEGLGFDRDQLLFTLRDFYLAGTETTASTLQWAIILLANHPDIQQRLHTEIESVIPRDRLPALDDKKMMPYTEAVILEIMRIKTTVPLGLPHETLHDTYLKGYFISKGTRVIANLYGTHMDPTVWIDPHIFNPERFFNAAVGEVINRDSVVSFSMGRRSCLGEILAQQELFLFLTGLVQHFKIRPREGEESVVYKELVSVTMAPIDYQVRLLPRNN